MWRATLAVGCLIAGCGGHRDETAPLVEPEATFEARPFGPVHSTTGDPYVLADRPQVRDGVLRVPVEHARACDDRQLIFEMKGLSPNTPTIVAAALVMDAAGSACTTEGTKVFEYDLLQQLGPGCYDALFLDTSDGTVRLPLHGLGCGDADHESRESLVVPPTEQQIRWGDAYRVVGEPSLVDGVVHLAARYAGGCGPHDWAVQFRDSRVDRRVRTSTADVQHAANGDRCPHLRREEVAIDVRPWLGDSCPDVLELHVPEVLPTGDVFDRAVLLAVEPEEDCVRAAEATSD